MDIKTNYQSVRPGSYLQGVDETNKTGEAAKLGGAQAMTAGMAVTFRNKVDEVYSQLGIPTLKFAKDMSAEEVEENLKSISTKLNSSTASFRGKPVMFDIYALMDLIQEMSQKMRNAMRELRSMENQVIQTNIKAQASAQRTAAISSMIAGIAMCVVQGAIATATTKSSISSMSKQSEMLAQGGVDVMSEQKNLANNVGNQEQCDLAVEKLAGEYEAVVDEIDLQMEEPNEIACNAERQALEDVKLEAERQGLTDQERAEVLKKMQAASDKYVDARLAEGDRVLTKNSEVVDRAAAEFKSVRQAANEELAMKGKISPAMQAKLDNATGKFLYARAKQVSIATKMMGSAVNADAYFIENPNKVQQSILSGSESMFKLTEDGAISKADAINFSKQQAKLTLVTGLNQALGQLGQNVISSLKELKMAGVTDLQGKQKMLEEDLDQIKDLFSQSLAVMQKVFQLFEAITQKESSTLENIIMA